MKKFSLLALLALALLAFTGGGTYAQGNSVTVNMKAQNGSGENGTATITGVGTNDVKVSVNLNNGPAEPQPAHIHKGSCANLDPTPAYPLTNIVSGKSDTTVMVSMSDLESGSYAINVHKSAAEVATYVSCGDIVANMAMSGGGTMPTTGNGNEGLILAVLGLAALGMVGTGLKVVRNKA